MRCCPSDSSDTHGPGTNPDFRACYFPGPNGLRQIITPIISRPRLCSDVGAPPAEEVGRDGSETHPRLAAGIEMQHRYPCGHAKILAALSRQEISNGDPAGFEPGQSGW